MTRSQNRLDWLLLAMMVAPFLLNVIGSVKDLRTAIELTQFAQQGVATQAQIWGRERYRQKGAKGSLITATEISYHYRDQRGLLYSGSFTSHCSEQHTHLPILYWPTSPSWHHIGTPVDATEYAQAFTILALFLPLLAAGISLSFLYITAWVERVTPIISPPLSSKQRRHLEQRIQRWTQVLYLLFIMNACSLVVGLVRSLNTPESPLLLIAFCSDTPDASP